ncbi:MAG: hypothetical protein ABFC34_07415 [Methanobacterium sp.]
MNVNDVYFSLRSNIDFFENKSNQPDFISKVKQSILLYNTLYFDAGAYTVSCGDNGSFNNYYPPEHMDHLNLEVPDSTSKGFYVGMQEEPNGKPFFPIRYSENSKNYLVCFQNIISEMGLEDEKFIKYEIPVLNSLGNDILSKAVWNTSDYKKYIDGYLFCKNRILENFHHSLIVSNAINASPILDGLHDKLIEEISKDVFNAADMRIDILKEINDLLKFILPNFSSLQIDEILDLRKDKLFENFRRMILKINNSIIVGDYNKSDSKALFMKELADEAKEIEPNNKKIVLNGLLFMMSITPDPTIGTVGNALSFGSFLKDLNDKKKFQNSSLAFVMKYAD